MTYADGSWNSVESLFNAVSEELETNLHEDVVEEVRPTNKRFSPFQKFDFSWSPTERAYLTVIHAAANDMVAEILSKPIFALDELYAKARIVDKLPNGKPKLDEDGRVVWKMRDGKPIEDWSSVSNTDIEDTLIRFQTIKLDVTNRVSDLYLEAVFAKYILKDVWNEKYSKILEGTVNEKSAAADMSARQDKYKAFSRYWLWFRANELKKDIDATIVLLGNIRSWRNWSK